MTEHGRPTRNPDFLIIGAMKAGTTTLFHDLNRQPGVYIPPDKEPHTLWHRQDDAEALAEYDRLFRAAPPGALCGDASTGYTKRSQFPGIPERAEALLGTDLKLIYVVRHPIDRMLSHYHHAVNEGSFAGTVLEALDAVPGMLDFSCYARQLEPWSQRFGMDRIRVVVFEDYIQRRNETVAALCGFLGCEHAADADTETKFNASDGKPQVKGTIRKAQFMWPYRALIRPLLPPAARQTLVRWLVPAAPPRLRKMPADAFERVASDLEADQRALAAACGWDAGPWDLTTFVEEETTMQTAGLTSGDAGS